MKIGIASDHRGVQLKARLTQLLQSLDCDVHDFGPFEAQSVDYPDFAAQVAREVSNGHMQSRDPDLRYRHRDVYRRE